jgi:pilus assembly protein Flp/PilA
MLKAYFFVKSFLTRKEEGATMVEYGLMVGLIAIVCIAAVTLVGTDLSALFSRISAALTPVAA